MERVFRYCIGMLQTLILVGFGISQIGCSKARFTQDKVALESASSGSEAAQQTGEGCYKEEFKTEPSPAKPVDVLFVLQTSSSINDIRQTIINGINGFVNNLPAGSDFNIAVMLSHGSTSDSSGRLFKAGAEPIVLKSSQLTNAQIEAALDAKLNNAPADAPSGGGEEGMFSLFNGITTPALLTESQSAGFFRSNAALSVVFIGDRRDICANVPPGVPAETDPVKIDARIRDCEGLTAAGLLNRLNLLKAGQTLKVSGIIYADSPAPAGKEIGYGYTDVISLNGGDAIDIANDNITAGLQPIIALGGQTSTQNEFTLAHPNADPNTIKVTVNGQPATFTYDGVKVTVTSPVPGGSTVIIEYCVNAFVGACKVFENVNDGATPTPSTQDLELVNRSGVSTAGAVRNLLVKNVSGGFTVDSAMAVSSMSSASGSAYLKVSGDIGSISNMSGTTRIDKAGNVGPAFNISGLFQLNALSLISFTNASGDACLKVKTIGKVQSTSGSKVIIADQVDEISALSGEVHVYGAVINTVTNTSGRICLHNGAKVLNYSNVSGFIGECQ